MPHKRNPVICERISGLARLLRGYAGVGLENIPLWHERDISHSSAERVVLADACIVLDYTIDRLRAVLAGLTIDAGAMARNLESTGGLIFSQRVLLALTEALEDREAAYRIVQGHAMETWKSGGSFRDRIAADPEVRARLRPEQLEALFDPSIFTRNLPAIFERVLASSWGRA
jgi:adenylosuccinate lyase